MKCIIVAVMIALAVAAEGSTVASYAIPLAYSVPQTTVIQQNVAPKYVVSGYAAPHVAAPYVSHAAYPTHSYAVPATVSYASHATHAAHSIPAAVSYAAPHATVYATPHAAVYAAPHAAVYTHVQKEASYVAANRGAVHEAPLPGHAINQKSLNVEPAPGTL